MGFIEETAKVLGINQETSTNVFCYICPEKGIVVEGYRKIYELSETKITLLCDEGKKVDVSGQKLFIKEISHQEISINGIIQSVIFD